MSFKDGRRAKFPFYSFPKIAALQGYSWGSEDAVVARAQKFRAEGGRERGRGNAPDGFDLLRCRYDVRSGLPRDARKERIRRHLEGRNQMRVEIEQPDAPTEKAPVFAEGGYKWWRVFLERRGLGAAFGLDPDGRSGAGDSCAAR